MEGVPLLSIVIFLPLVGAAAGLFVPRANERALQALGLVTSLAVFAVSVLLWFAFDPGAAGFQLEERAPWVPSVGIGYHVGVDGISLLLVLLTTFLMPLTFLSTWTSITARVKEFTILMLVLETAMLGTFLALDLFLFYVFWELMLVPMYFLIGVWGGPRRIYAAVKFFLFTMAGSVLMLLAIVALWLGSGTGPGLTGRTFDFVDILRTPVPRDLQPWLFAAFALAFAIKVPMFPFHTWLPDAHVEAPTAGSVILAAVLLKMGTYGFLRFSLPILPDGTKQFVPLMITLSIIAIVYGALVAMMQPDMKKLVAYSSVSHMGFVMLGMFALNPNGLNGSIIQQINHGVSTGALFLIVGIIYERRHTREIAQLGGISNVMPVYAVVFLIMTMSSIGLPLLNGFIGEFTIVMGALQENLWWAVAAGAGIVLGAAYMLWLYQRTMLGRLDNPANEKLLDMNLRELATLVPLIIMAFWIGLYPAPFFRVLDKPVNKIVAKVRPDYFQGAPRLNAQIQERR